MEDDLFDNRRQKSIGNQPLRGIIPTDQVDALPTQGIDNILDAETPEADAGSDAIDREILALKGKLAAIPGLARNCLDLHASRPNLRDFLRKEVGDQAGVVI